MNLGGANEQQTKLNFAPSKPTIGEHATPQDTAGTSDKDDNNRSKRGRYELENEGRDNNNNNTNEINIDAHLLLVPSATNILPSSGSKNSLLNTQFRPRQH